MQHEVRSIPPAPRRLRVRALLAHRWPLLVVGGTLVVIGSLIAWAMFLQSGAALYNGSRLAEEPTETFTGTITELLPERRFDHRLWDFVHYRFPLQRHGQQVDVDGMCFVPSGSHQLHGPAQVVVLLDDGDVHCIAGGVLRADRRWLFAQFWLVAMVVPGGLILLGWLAGLFQLRQVLVHGDVSVGRVLHVQPVAGVLPEMLRVDYEFRDHRATVRRNRHWVRAHGALGRRLTRHRGTRREAESYEQIPVLHDRRMPHWNRLLLPQDFLQPTAAEHKTPELL